MNRYAFFLIASMLLVGSNVGIGKSIVAFVPVVILATLRFVIANAVLWPLFSPVKMRAVKRGEWLNLFLQAFFGTFMFTLLMLNGVQRTSAVAAGVITSTIPAVVALFAWRAGVPFVARLADPGLLPMRTWKRHIGIGLSEATHAALCALPPQGAEPLRARIADYLGQYRGIACDAADIFITTGIRHSLDLIARTIAGSGSRIAIEDPGYRTARRIFELAGAESISVAVGPEGIDTHALSAHRRVAAAYVTPAHQSPLGVTMSISRRLDLLDWAHARRTWVIEDDYDGEFGYQSAPLPALKSLDVRERVIYCGSFNKTLFSGLRVGFMVVPAALRAPISALVQAVGRPVGTTEQLALASFIGSGDFAKHLRTSRHAYLQRRDAVLEQLRRYADGQYAISGEHTGFHFVLWLGRGIDERTFAEEAANIGLALEPLRAFCTQAALPAGVVVGYSALSVAQARYAGKKLGQLLAGVRRDAAA